MKKIHIRIQVCVLYIPIKGLKQICLKLCSKIFILIIQFNRKICGHDDEISYRCHKDGVNIEWSIF